MGALLPAFALVEIFGFRSTMKLGAICNLAIAAVALLLSLRATDAQESGETEAKAAIPSLVSSVSSPRLILSMLFLTGLVSLAMEVVWIRQFTPYIGTEVYGFAIILGSYLAATFIGSRIYRRWLLQYSPDDETVAWLLLGLAGLLPLVAADPRLHMIGFLRVPLGIMAISGLMGFVTPMLVDQYSEGNPDRAGRAYAVNVIGCILGPLLSGFLLLPYLGERQSLILLCLPLFALLYIFRPKTEAAKSRYGFRFYLENALVALALIVFSKDYLSNLQGGMLSRDYAATVVATGQGMQRFLFVNGVTITQLTPVTKIMAHLPLAMHAQPPKDALVICFGMGTTHRSMLSWGISSTAVELLPSVPRTFTYFHADGARVLQDPNSHLIIDDGRQFLEKTRRQFDVITLDPPPPTSAAGVSLLYSKEFYEVAKRRLKPGGILQQWTTALNAHWSAPTDPRVSLLAITKALMESFPYVRCYGSLEGWGFHFLASMSPIPDLTAAELASRMSTAAVADMLEWGPGTTAEQQFALVLGVQIPLARILEFNDIDVQALDDDRPVNEYYLLRAWLPSRWSKAIYARAARR
jgi:spermidine synthase